MDETNLFKQGPCNGYEGLVKDLTQKKLGPFVLRVFEEFLGCVSLHNLPEVHKKHLVRHAPGKAHFVSDDDHGHPLLGQFDHDIQHFFDHFGIKG